jgi:hypothetical protein
VAIYGNKASNNPTLYYSLHKLLKQQFVDLVQKLDPPGKNYKLVLFKGDETFIHYLAHVLNLVAKSMLKVSSAGSHKNAKRVIKRISADKWETFQIEEIPQSAIAQLRLIAMWILASD